MSIFELRQFVIDEYNKYFHNFLSIADESIRAFIKELFLKNQTFWPDARLQLNPSYKIDLEIKFYPLSPLGGIGSACLRWVRMREILQFSQNIHDSDS
jgi:hypothetical protein